MSKLSQRVKRCQQRRKAGGRCVQIELTGDALDAFIRLGTLPPDRRDDVTVLQSIIARLCRAGCNAIQAGIEPPRDERLEGVLAGLPVVTPGNPGDEHKRER